MSITYRIVLNYLLLYNDNCYHCSPINCEISRVQKQLFRFDRSIPIPAKELLHFKKDFIKNSAHILTAPLAVPCIFYRNVKSPTWILDGHIHFCLADNFIEDATPALPKTTFNPHLNTTAIGRCR